MDIERRITRVKGHIGINGWTHPSPIQNQLLAALPDAISDHILSLLEPVSLLAGDVLIESGVRIKHAYFPVSTVVSVLDTLENGDATQIAMIGNEGMIGASIVMGDDMEVTRAIVLSAGLAYRIRARELRKELQRFGYLERIFLHYLQSYITQTAQHVACNRHHRIDQQLPFFLLQLLDRLPDNKINITQEVLGSVLGVRREGITEAARRLRSKGIISYSRGHITVLNRSLLERASCECYRVTRHDCKRMIS